MADLLFTTDLENATKEQLRALVKRVREETGKPIDLRKADAIALRQYLEDYKATQATESECDVIEPADISNFEGIEQDVMQVTEWLNSCPLTCAPCSYQVCDLPEPEVEKPPTFNTIASTTIDIILQGATAYGNIVNAAWIGGILTDCRVRSIRPERVKEPLILKDHVFLGLAGLPLDSLDTLKAVIRRPEEFGDMPPEVRESKAFYDNIGGLIGSDALSDLFLYHNIRDNLNYLQVRLGISSLEPRHYAIRDKLFSTIDYDCQLQLLPSDRIELELQVPRICEYFQSLTSDYEIFRVYDDEVEKPLPKDFDLARQASIADYGWIYAESFNWKPHSGGGYIGTHTDRLHPDRIELYLSFWHDGEGDYRSFLRLIAYHPDASRRPWLAS
ncbi:MAG: hypothetical protein KME22_11450 [Hassallia sp. WJT32-NPBG1]|jgi:hypothetical protein|nr:hypothetical protein [Hassallia sp. WJT32-NPBG1]